MVVVIVVVVVVVVVVLVLVVVVVVGGGGVILGEVKARPKDIISFSLDYISKSKVQTSNPSSSPIPLDTPARPADFVVARMARTYVQWLLSGAQELLYMNPPALISIIYPEPSFDAWTSEVLR